MTSYTEDNEVWAGFYGPDSGKSNPDSCAKGYYPTVSSLDSLYSKYPDRSIKTVQGWPIDRSYWSGTYSSSFSTETFSRYSAVDPTMAAIRHYPRRTLTETVPDLFGYADGAGGIDYAHVNADAGCHCAGGEGKTGDTIPLLITTTDAAGNPVGNIPFTLKRDKGTARTTTYTTRSTPTMQLTQSGQASQSWSFNGTYYGVTGADGTLAVDLAESSGPRQNVLTAGLYNSTTVTASLPAVFTTITSPDSNKANMWGHMPETFTASNGTEFMRPRLMDELDSATDTTAVIENNEKWYTVKTSRKDVAPAQ